MKGGLLIALLIILALALMPTPAGGPDGFKRQSQSPLIITTPARPSFNTGNILTDLLR